MLHKHSSVFEVILNKILPQNNNDSNNNNDNKRARLYFHVIHLFIHSFFQILSNIFLRTTAFNTLKSIFLKKMIYFKNFFFFSSPPSIPFQKQVEQTLFSASIGHHIADQRSMCRENSRVAGVCWTCVITGCRMGHISNQY